MSSSFHINTRLKSEDPCAGYYLQMVASPTAVCGSLLCFTFRGMHGFDTDRSLLESSPRYDRKRRSFSQRTILRRGFHKRASEPAGKSFSVISPLELVSPSPPLTVCSISHITLLRQQPFTILSPWLSTFSQFPSPVSHACLLCGPICFAPSPLLPCTHSLLLLAI